VSIPMRSLCRSRLLGVPPLLLCFALSAHAQTAAQPLVCPSCGTARITFQLPQQPIKAPARVQVPAVDLDALAARGEILASEDTMATELRNLQPEGPARRGFDIGMGAAEGQTLQGPGKQAIHDSLPPAEQDGFTMAVLFSLARNRKKIIDLAPEGAAIAEADPLAVELRNQQSVGPVRRGFDIGMAAAKGQTAPGPGKQGIHDSLSQPEQLGFTVAVSFSLERNRNADLAARGAAVARMDSVVAAARDATTNVFYRLGFDIASGIFGDPSLGALGNTATGPGSLGIRDSLSASAQRGFNASVTLHLSRTYLVTMPGELDADEAAARISEYRAENNLPPVTIDPDLMQIATLHARRMAGANELTHALPDEGSFSQRLKDGNFETSHAVENLAGGFESLAKVLELWRESQIHSDNLLLEGVSSIGIAFAIAPKSKYKFYWSLILAERSAP
jgi:uncharacterized protein YkwD